MFCVFAAFVLGEHQGLKMFGLGLATAVLLDATVVRLVLVPATMALLGDRNWWLPAWLDRLLPVVRVEPIEEVEPGVDLETTGERVPASSVADTHVGPDRDGSGARSPGEPIEADRHR